MFVNCINNNLHNGFYQDLADATSYWKKIYVTEMYSTFITTGKITTILFSQVFTKLAQGSSTIYAWWFFLTNMD